MKKKEITGKLKSLPTDKVTTVMSELGPVYAYPIKKHFLSGYKLPCSECAFGKTYSGADVCPYRTACFGHTRPDRTPVIFILR